MRERKKEKETQVKIIDSEVVVFWGIFRTDVPAVIGIVISNTMIFAVNVVASGTIDVGGHSILPTFK